MSEISLSQFYEKYYNNLSLNCTPDCFADMCSGCNLKTLND
jgi:hypothetical protein